MPTKSDHSQKMTTNTKNEPRYIIIYVINHEHCVVRINSTELYPHPYNSMTTEGCTNFPEIQQPPQNSMHQKGDMKQVSYWGLKNIRHHHTRFSCYNSLVPGICASWLWRHYLMINDYAISKEYKASVINGEWLWKIWHCTVWYTDMTLHSLVQRYDTTQSGTKIWHWTVWYTDMTLHSLI
jgi:hypothetical protein